MASKKVEIYSKKKKPTPSLHIPLRKLEQKPFDILFFRTVLLRFLIFDGVASEFFEKLPVILYVIDS